MRGLKPPPPSERTKARVFPQPVKPSIDLIGLSAWLKPCPCYRAVEFKVEMEFFSSLFSPYRNANAIKGFSP